MSEKSSIAQRIYAIRFAARAFQLCVLLDGTTILALLSTTSAGFHFSHLLKTAVRSENTTACTHAHFSPGRWHARCYYTPQDDDGLHCTTTLNDLYETNDVVVTVAAPRNLTRLVCANSSFPKRSWTSLSVRRCILL